MRHSRYKVHFGDRFIDIEAFSRLDAAILACAERIRDGLHCDISYIDCEDGRGLGPNNPDRHCIRLAIVADAPKADPSEG